MNLPKILKPLLPGYRQAVAKREMEKRLRAEGFSRSEALKAVAAQFNDHEKPRR